jgi:predicted phage tail protein
MEINGPSSKLDTISTTYYSVTLAPGSYTWRVRAYNASGWSDWSVARTLTVQAQPEPIPWWIYLGIIAATMVIVLLLLLRIRSRRPTLGTNDDDDTKIYR